MPPARQERFGELRRRRPASVVIRQDCCGGGGQLAKGRMRLGQCLSRQRVVAYMARAGGGAPEQVRRCTAAGRSEIVFTMEVREVKEDVDELLQAAALELWNLAELPT